MNVPDIFLSYNREDAAVAKLYADAFAAAGLDVWWDQTLKSGEAYDKVTEAALRGAKAVVVLWSPHSVDSRWVRAEATIAERNNTLMPVTIEPCERPVMFELTQTAELSHWRGDTSDKSWQAFLTDVRRKIGPEAPAAAAAPQPALASAGAGAPAMVAVIPFTHRGADDDLEMLAEDLTEDVTRELAYNGYIKVIAAGTMAAWRGKPIDHRDLGARLEAHYLVEGRLQRNGENVRLTAQLIDAMSGNVLWSARIARKVAEIETSPEALPAELAAQLGEQVMQCEVSQAMTKPAHLTGWDHILRGVGSAFRAGADSSRRGIEEARLAVAAAPEVGLAHASLASALAIEANVIGRKLDDNQIREIQAHIREAMRLDGNNPTVLFYLVVAYAGLGESETVLRLARRTVELYPHSPVSYLVLGMGNTAMGRIGDAIAAYTQQNRLSPFDGSRYLTFTYLGMCYLLEGQPEEAEAALDRALELNPAYVLTHKWKAIVAARLGKESAALDAVRQMRMIEPEISIEQHVWQIERNANLRDRTAEPIATLRRLWQASGGEGQGASVGIRRQADEGN